MDTKAIEAEFEKAERLLVEDDENEDEDAVMDMVNREHIEQVRDVLGWVLGHFPSNPLEDY